MYIIVFGIFILKLQISVSQIPGFPAHIDLQKVGETIFNYEKFNILKPTTHLITDHFKDAMLRSENAIHPAKRVFIDHNGFRHDWSGFGEKIKSLRKTDLKYVSASFEKGSHNSTNDKKNTIAAVRNNNISDNRTSNVTDENNEHDDENNNSDTVEKTSKEDTESLDSIETTTATQKNNSTTVLSVTLEKRLRAGTKSSSTKKSKSDKKKDSKKKKDDGSKKKDKKKTDKDKNKKEDKKKTDKDDKAKKDTEKSDKKKETPKIERTVATTTFFCPFFGVITMSAFID